MYYVKKQFRSSRKSKVEIIPLIDVMFLLLCFFIYATMNMVIQKGIFVDLAVSETSESRPTQEETLILSVNKANEFYVNEREVSLPQMERDLIDAKERGSIIVVNADEEASHGQVIQLLDLVRKQGIKEAVFSVEPKE